jgi:hypothetical protein
MNTSSITTPPDKPDDGATRFAELLPWLANGRLGRDDAQWMGAWMVTHPEAQQDYLRLLATQSKLVDRHFEFDAEASLKHALQYIRKEQQEKPATDNGWKYWLKQQFSNMRFHPLGYAAVLLIAVQSGVLFNQKLMLDEKYGVVRSTQISNNANDLVLLRMTFDPDIREEELRLAIASVNGKIVGGPGRLGDYYVRVEGTAEEAKKILKTYPKVISALAVTTVPEKD